MFCPQAVEWGSVSDLANVGVSFLAAGATLAAVIVALRTAKKSESLARELWAQEHAAQMEREQAKRQTIAFAIDQELIGVFHQAAFSWRKLNPEEKEPAGEIPAVKVSSLPTEGFELMDRFIADFPLFPPKLSRKLLRIVACLSRMRDMLADKKDMTLTPGDPAATDISQLLEVLMAEMRLSRIELREQIPTEVETVGIEPLPTGLPGQTT